jgi:hypothetical protein
VLALEEVGFRFTCLMGDELTADGSIKGRILEQLFFMTDAQIAFARRFVTNQVLLIDEYQTEKMLNCLILLSRW